jgi:diguanylate cyclase (GGDEF)-like protein
MLHREGSFRWMLSRGVAVRDASGKVLRMAGSQTDITEGKVSDPLTGLPNRLLFIDRVGRLVKRTKRHKDQLFAVLFMDLDGFKMINDSMGHLIGDQLLIGVASRLEKCLRSTDTVSRIGETFTVARLGGDEFTVLLDHIKDPSDAKRAAERMMKALASPFILGGKEVFTSVSIGIALSNSSYEQAEDILRDADTAMYRAKSLGKARYEVFDADMRASVIARLQLETDLRHALEREEFRNFYQPIVDLASGEIVGFEALLRWQHPTRGLLGPEEFIPVAEETGLIRELGWWNLREACRQISEWRAALAAHSHLTISVNLSAKQFLQPNLVEDIRKFLRELALAPEALKLEITESTVMADPAAAVEMLQQIKSLGIRLAIDDFGTGYSSLSYLHRFPLDTLKIDRSFISGMGEEGEGMEIARTILPMANNLRLDVVAEGVETIQQVAMLKKLHCKYAQGFYFSRPLSAEGTAALLAGGLTWQAVEQTK